MTLATYIELVSASLDFTRAASEDGRGVPLLIIEPYGDIGLPLLPPAAETPGVPPAQRTRTFKLSDGLKRLGLTVGEVTQLKPETGKLFVLGAADSRIREPASQGWQVRALARRASVPLRQEGWNQVRIRVSSARGR